MDLTEILSALVLKLAQSAEPLEPNIDEAPSVWSARESQLAVFDDDFSNFRAAMSDREKAADAALAIACSAVLLAASARRDAGHPEAA
jgi:hypothetical protein